MARLIAAAVVVVGIVALGVWMLVGREDEPTTPLVAVSAEPAASGVARPTVDLAPLTEDPVVGEAEEAGEVAPVDATVDRQPASRPAATLVEESPWSGQVVHIAPGDFAIDGKLQTVLKVRDLSTTIQLSGVQLRGVVFTPAPKSEDGLSTTYHDNGEKKEEGEIRNGKRVGIWTEWYPNRQRRSEGRYFHGEKHGLWTTWYETGERASVGEYLYDRREGAWVESYADGTRQSLGTYRGGDLEGTYRSFHGNGERASEGLYEDGLQEGAWTSWHANGEVESRGEYHYGKRDGRWRFFDAEGNVDEAQSGLYEAGERVRD